jgi:hypothetical protein
LKREDIRARTIAWSGRELRSTALFVDYLGRDATIGQPDIVPFEKVKKNPTGNPIGLEKNAGIALLFHRVKPCSTIAASELNFCVRNGNRCGLAAIDTGKSRSKFTLLSRLLSTSQDHDALSFILRVLHYFAQLCHPFKHLSFKQVQFQPFR